MPTNKNTLVFKSREDEVLKVWSVMRAFLFNMDAAGKKKKEDTPSLKFAGSFSPFTSL